MKKNVALLMLLGLFALSLASCSMEKRLYTKGYHMTWHTLKKKPTVIAHQEITDSTSSAILELPIEAISRKKIFNNKTTSIAFKTIQAKQDTVIPSEDDDYVGSPNNLNSNPKNPFASPAIRRPKTIEELKVSIGRDFKLTLLSILAVVISLGFLYLISLAPLSLDGEAKIFFALTLIISVIAFFFYLIRAIARTIKLSALKAVGKSDETEINKISNSQPEREPEHQYAKRLVSWVFKSLFDPWGRLKLLLILAGIGFVILIALTI